jgi:hypothetical protein
MLIDLFLGESLSMTADELGLTGEQFHEGDYIDVDSDRDYRIIDIRHDDELGTVAQCEYVGE